MNSLQQDTVRAITNVFETGRILGNYASIAVMKGDSGHLSYGRSQASLGSGTLYELLDVYCKQPNATFADRLRPSLSRFQTRDVTLDVDEQIKSDLKQAGSRDPVMRGVQDQFFNKKFFTPACTTAEGMGIADPLGQAVVYDSFIQGGWSILKKRAAPMAVGQQRDWVQKYVDLRRNWLTALDPPLPTTVYRMDSFASLIKLKNWDLSLPLTVHGVTITPEALAGNNPSPANTASLLCLTQPYTRGDDVKALQRALTAQGVQVQPDGIFGPFMDQVVQQWQTSHGITEKGVGPRTRVSLGLPEQGCP
jgi:chitosanase